MSKYKTLWNFIRTNCEDQIKLTYSEIKQIASVVIDHSFLAYKKELLEYGYKVEKISMKDQSIYFAKTGE